MIDSLEETVDSYEGCAYWLFESVGDADGCRLVCVYEADEVVLAREVVSWWLRCWGRDVEHGRVPVWNMLRQYRGGGRRMCYAKASLASLLGKRY